MVTKVKKWGNSLAVRLPREVTSYLNIKEDGEVSFEKQGGNFVLKVINKKKKLNLKDLCKQITPENRYEEIDWGEPVGKEIW